MGCEIDGVNYQVNPFAAAEKLVVAGFAVQTIESENPRYKLKLKLAELHLVEAERSYPTGDFVQLPTRLRPDRPEVEEGQFDDC